MGDFLKKNEFCILDLFRLSKFHKHLQAKYERMT